MGVGRILLPGGNTSRAPQPVTACAASPREPGGQCARERASEVGRGRSGQGRQQGHGHQCLQAVQATGLK